MIRARRLTVDADVLFDPGWIIVGLFVLMLSVVLIAVEQRDARRRGARGQFRRRGGGSR
ncbi:hypothetical protein G1H11_14285 [Phytoactinopolyspora alkaliphila]|uniref:Uncharacterized protein n=1 Tax=Phytoactinopolyspora alkaliphila TaxID=1783498 RepID=A0A6N9YNF3_9ACTN|nr:hypothetical protein [Phytoactinopolyspora alkaliphila]NED96475.1 hypothetical protein [Phytoactinopolyspora alkaliphila]